MDAKSVDMIVRQVIEALQAQGVAVATNPKQPARTGRLLGVRLKEHTAGGNEVLVNPGKKTAKAAPQPARIFITAELLAQRAAASAGGTIALACNEFLTPAAVDLADIKHWTVQRGTGILPVCAEGVPPSRGAAVPAACRAGILPALGLITVNPTANVENFLAAMRNEGLAAQSFNHADCWMRNLESLCDALAGGEVKLGAIVAPYAADAMLLAGKCKGVRAVQGSSVAAVAAAVRHYDANLLVIEHAVSTFHEMRQMVRTFTAPRQAPANTALMERVAKKEGRP